jgi:hypothetical protein
VVPVLIELEAGLAAQINDDPAKVGMAAGSHHRARTGRVRGNDLARGGGSGRKSEKA